MASNGDISLEQIKNKTIDLERIPVDEVFENLKCTRESLTTAEEEKRLHIFGPNKLEKKKKRANFLSSWALCGIFYHGFIEENNAGNAAAALMAGLAPKTKVLRDGKWGEQDASILVPGDVISVKLGDIIPANARLLEGDALKIDQSALTSESLPVTKNPGDGVFSESTCKQVMYPIQNMRCRYGIDNLLVLLIGGIPIAMPIILSVTMAIGFHRLSQQGAITKRMTAIEEMTGMDVLCSDKIRTLTLNKLTVDKSFIQVFVSGMDNDTLVLLAARASRVENQDAIDASIVGMLGDPKEAEAGITELDFFPFNPVDKCTAITYINSNGEWYHCSKGAPEQIIELCRLTRDLRKKAHDVIDNFGNRGLRSLGSKDEAIAAIPIDELIEKANGFAGFFLEHKYKIVKRLQDMKHICGMTRDGVNNAPKLKNTDIGIVVADATDAARSASNIVLTKPGLSVIVSAMLTSRSIFQRMKNYTIYVVSITIRILMGFMLVAIIWKFDLSPFMVLIIAILNDGTIMTISKDKVKPSPMSDSRKLKKIFTTGIVLGAYMKTFGVKPINDNMRELTSALYLHVSIISQALIFVTRSRSNDKSNQELSDIAEQAKKHAEIARLTELNTLKGHIESIVKLKGIDIDTI
ncbi:hypothetical protein REPUB_Repub03eG0026100 [Reevesia pubescens]